MMRTIVIKVKTDSDESIRFLKNDLLQEIHCCSEYFYTEDAVVEEEKHGKWIDDRGFYKCTACNKHWTQWWSVIMPEERMYIEMKYCPNCGAKMDRSED